MRTARILAMIFVSVMPSLAAAQTATPRSNTVAIGGDVGFLAPDNGDSERVRPLQETTGHVDAFVEYYYTDRVSFRAMYGWASPEFESRPEQNLRRQHLSANVICNWSLQRFRLFATIGGGAYFLSRRDTESTDVAVAKPGGTLGWGGEFYLRTFALRSEMTVHILNDERKLPELNGNTLTAFTWTFGIKVPF